MKPFELSLQSIIDAYDDQNILLSDAISVSRNDLQFLKSLGLVSLRPQGDNLFRVVLTDDGRTYFFRKRRELKRSIVLWTINLTVSIMSGLAGSIITILVHLKMMR